MIKLFHDLFQLPHAPPRAIVFVEVGFLITRLWFHDRPVARFLVQLVSFAGVGAVLVGAGVIPSGHTRQAGSSPREIVINLFKVAWRLASAWLLVGILHFALGYGRRPRETPPRARG
jgi:hypothetical protein